MQRKYHIKKGDLVIINSGEYKGQQGRILEVLYNKETAIVEGVNMISKHTKPNAKSPQGGITKKEAPVHISNMNLVGSWASGPRRPLPARRPRAREAARGRILRMDYGSRPTVSG
jgi:large subunit ribosomal protein L24